MFGIERRPQNRERIIFAWTPGRTHKRRSSCNAWPLTATGSSFTSMQSCASWFGSIHRCSIWSWS